MSTELESSFQHELTGTGQAPNLQEDDAENALFHREARKLCMTTPTFSVLHIDEDLLLVDKPARLPTHAPEVSRPGFVELLQQVHGPLGVHQRLDAESSGVMVFSRSERGARCLARQFEEHSVRKFNRTQHLRQPALSTHPQTFEDVLDAASPERLARS
ncbi:MAG: pseudouridine synthase, partial [Myxococcota bacterium]|nr:pseudouridine synthase [Myxococcota bacterium]